MRWAHCSAGRARWVPATDVWPEGEVVSSTRAWRWASRVSKVVTPQIAEHEVDHPPSLLPPSNPLYIYTDCRRASPRSSLFILPLKSWDYLTISKRSPLFFLLRQWRAFSIAAAVRLSAIGAIGSVGKPFKRIARPSAHTMAPQSFVLAAIPSDIIKL